MLPILPPRSVLSLPAHGSLTAGRLVAAAQTQTPYYTGSRYFGMATAYSSASRLRLRRTCPPGTRIASVRRLHGSSSLAYPPTKEGQDKDSLTPRSTEYSKSGDDDAAAATSKTAFDPNQTAPETEDKSADQESGQNVNPLNVSPANRGVSQPRESTEGGAESSSGESRHSQSQRQRTSGKGSAPKSGSGKHGG
jgi:hypothetical protein